MTLQQFDTGNGMSLPASLLNSTIGRVSSSSSSTETPTTLKNISSAPPKPANLAPYKPKQHLATRSMPPAYIRLQNVAVSMPTTTTTQELGRFLPQIPLLSSSSSSSSSTALTRNPPPLYSTIAPSPYHNNNVHAGNAGLALSNGAPRDVAALIRSVTLPANSAVFDSTSRPQQQQQQQQPPIIFTSAYHPTLAPENSSSSAPPTSSTQTVDSALIIHELLKQISTLQATQQRQQQQQQQSFSPAPEQQQVLAPKPPHPIAVAPVRSQQLHRDSYTSVPQNQNTMLRPVAIRPSPPPPTASGPPRIIINPPLSGINNPQRAATTTLSLTADTLERLQSALALVNATATSGSSPIFRIAPSSSSSGSNATGVSQQRPAIITLQQQADAAMLNAYSENLKRASTANSPVSTLASNQTMTAQYMTDLVNNVSSQLPPNHLIRLSRPVQSMPPPLMLPTSSAPQKEERHSIRLSTTPAKSFVPQYEKQAVLNDSTSNALSALIAASTQLQCQTQQQSTNGSAKNKSFSPPTIKSAVTNSKPHVFSAKQQQQQSFHNGNHSIPRQTYGSFSNPQSYKQHSEVPVSSAAADAFDRQRDDLRRLLTAAQGQWQMQANSAVKDQNLGDVRRIANRQQAAQNQLKSEAAARHLDTLQQQQHLHTRMYASSSPSSTVSVLPYASNAASLQPTFTQSIDPPPGNTYPVLSNMLSSDDKDQASQALYRRLYDSTRETPLASKTPPVSSVLTTTNTSSPTVAQLFVAPDHQPNPAARNFDSDAYLDSIRAMQKVVSSSTSEPASLPQVAAARSNSVDSEVQVLHYTNTVAASVVKKKSASKEVDYEALLSAVRTMSSSPFSTTTSAAMVQLRSPHPTLSTSPVQQGCSSAILQQKRLTSLILTDDTGVADASGSSASEQMVVDRASFVTKENTLVSPSTCASADFPGSRMWSVPFPSVSPQLKSFASPATEIDGEVAVRMEVNPHFSAVTAVQLQPGVAPTPPSSGSLVGSGSESAQNFSPHINRTSSPSMEQLMTDNTATLLKESDDVVPADELPLDLTCPARLNGAKRLRSTDEEDDAICLSIRSPLDFSGKPKKMEREAVIDWKRQKLSPSPTSMDTVLSESFAINQDEVGVTSTSVARPIMVTKATNTEITLESLSLWLDVNKSDFSRKLKKLCDAGTQTSTADESEVNADATTSDVEAQPSVPLLQDDLKAAADMDDTEESVALQQETCPDIVTHCAEQNSSAQIPLDSLPRKVGEQIVEPVIIRFRRRPPMNTSFFQTKHGRRGGRRGRRCGRGAGPRNQGNRLTQSSLTIAKPSTKRSTTISFMRKSSPKVPVSEPQLDSVWIVNSPASVAAADVKQRKSSRSTKSASPHETTDLISQRKNRHMHKITLDNSCVDSDQGAKLTEAILANSSIQNEEKKNPPELQVIETHNEEENQVVETAKNKSVDERTAGGLVADVDNADDTLNSSAASSVNSANSVVDDDEDLSELQGNNPRWSYTLQELIPKASRTVYALLDNSAMLQYYKQAGPENTTRRNNPYRKFRCVGCDVKFIDRQCLAIHQRRAAFSLQFRCPSCPPKPAAYNFINECEFHQHIVKHLLKNETNILGLDSSRFQWA